MEVSKLKYLLVLSFQVLLISVALAQPSTKEEPLDVDAFYRRNSGQVYCLKEVLSTTGVIKGLCINKSDLIPSAYGELCILDSILKFNPDRFLKKIRAVESLYLAAYLPEHIVQLLVKATSIKNIMLKPVYGAYTPKELQQICLLQQFKEVNYLEGADTSLAFINCLQGFEQLDTLVWLNRTLQNPYLGQLTNITTLLIEQYLDINDYSNWSSYRYRPFNFPAQLKTIKTSVLSYHSLFKRIQECKQLEYLVDESGIIIHPKMKKMYTRSEVFPMPLPTVEELFFDAAPDYIPENIHLWRSLKRLNVDYISSNPVLRLPPSFYQLTTLEQLNMGIAELSDSIRYLQRLTDLSIHIGKPIAEVIPDSIVCLTGLKKLSIYNKGSTRYPLPNSIYALTNLNVLYLKDYTISDSIRFLPELRKLSLSNINFLPDSIVHLKKLQKLDLRHCVYKAYPQQMYVFKNLDTLLMGSIVYDKKSLINARKLKPLTKLKYFESDFRAIANELHYRRIYRALPENCKVQLEEDWESPSTATSFNVGFYLDYGWRKAAFTGIELLYHTSPKYDEEFVKKAGRFRKQTTTKHRHAALNPFYFHTFSFGVEWNYLQRPDLLMGYRIGYTYSRVKEPVSFQVDLIAYTNYTNKFDVRLAPRIAVTPIRTNFAYIYLYYSYKIPLIPLQEQTIIPLHSIGCNIRLTVDWENIGFPFPGVF